MIAAGLMAAVYGPLEGFIEKTWVLKDFELLK